MDRTSTHKMVSVISGCNFAFAGLAGLLKRENIVIHRVSYDVEEASNDAFMVSHHDSMTRLFVFFHSGIGNVLEALKKTVEIINNSGRNIEVVAFGQESTSWLYRMFASLVADKKKLKKIYVMPCKTRKESISSDDFVLLEPVAIKEELHQGYIFEGLTPRELDAAIYFLRGLTVKQQSLRDGISIKTIYIHRQKALQKLQPAMHCVSGVPGKQNPPCPAQTPVAHELILTDEDVAKAIEKNEVFPVYQAIVDRQMRVVGFEILLRWQHGNALLMPCDFLHNLRSRYIWLKLTAIVINAAVHAVNKYQGAYYFAVNIPAVLASGNALPRMAKKALELLHNPAWAEKLVFEFAENIDITQDKDIVNTMARIKETGCKLYLDDCFSRDHVMFPVRQIHFDGLKLDKDLIDKFTASETDSSLIKALIYFSQMTGCACVAEGVDSQAKFAALAEMGVNRFQGFLFSPPVEEARLNDILQRFNAVTPSQKS
ncbi:EAL domain-containing protein [Enterobacter soli]|uniref:EAL domain-containing protein n=1 Tax=Enterobacter soli TaxID=885040 RepID=UPI0034CE3755